MNNKMMIALAMAMLVGCSSNEKDYDATGTFEATETTVSAEQSGTLLQFALEEGDNIEAGREVGLIDTTQIWLKMQQTETSKTVYQSQKPDMEKQIAVTRQQLAKAKTEQRRYQELVDDGAAPSKMRRIRCRCCNDSSMRRFRRSTHNSRRSTPSCRQSMCRYVSCRISCRSAIS